MTATDELRRLLDERGAEWEDMSIRPYACTSWRDPDGEPCTALEGADDIPDGKLSAQALLTPEQAIEATLGRGTCRLEPYAKEICGELCHTFKCSACKSTVATPRVDYYILSQLFKYCPFCGRRVVEE